MAYQIDQKKSDREYIFACRVYTIAIFLLIESILQWQLIPVIFPDLTDKLLENDQLLFMMLGASLFIITLNRFLAALKYSMSCFIYFVFTLVVVELTIMGAANIMTNARLLDFTVSIVVLILIVFIHSFIGVYMISTNTLVFVACLSLWMFVCIVGVLMLLTILLFIDFEITYFNVMSIIVYVVVLFDISYKARLINSSSAVMSLKDCLSSALTIYGEFILLLITTLDLAKQQSEFW